MRLGPLLFVLASLFLAAPAAAEETRWYGWQTLAVDAAATAIIVTSVSGQDGGSRALDIGTGSGKMILGLGIGSYALGGAAVHLAHGQPFKAIASVGVRAVSPAVMTGAGMLVAIPACGGGGYCALAGAFFGMIAGAFVGSLVDAAAFAHEPARPAKVISVGLEPTRGGATAGISGSF